MKYLICLDLDGCVLDDNKKVGKELIDVVTLLKQKGCIIAFNTTRNFNRVKKYLPLLNPDYINCLGGCLVRKSNNEELFNEYMSYDILKKVFDITNEYSELNLVCSEWTDEEFVTNQDYALIHNKKYLSKNDIQNLHSYKLIYLFDEYLPQDILPRLKACNVNATLSQKNKYLRIMPKRDKWDGIKIILNDLNKSDIKVIAFGNDLTDYQTLQNADIGVAMINSEKELITSAKYKTKYSNNDDGIAKFLKGLDELNI